MNQTTFLDAFGARFSAALVERPTGALEDPDLRRLFDPCPDVEGMSSPKKLRLLELAYGLLAPSEAWLEVGTFKGKSLIAAMAGNAPRTTYACDDFSQFDALDNTHATLMENLESHGLKDQVVFHNGDFREFLLSGQVNHPVAGYFVDGPHDYESQYDCLRLAEPLLAEEALVIVDDWRCAEDSHSGAKEGSEAWMARSERRWTTLMELPARFNGDLAMWWNGLGVLWCSKGASTR